MFVVEIVKYEFRKFLVMKKHRSYELFNLYHATTIPILLTSYWARPDSFLPS